MANWQRQQQPQQQLGAIIGVPFPDPKEIQSFFSKIILIIFTVFQSLLFYLFLFFFTCRMRVESEYQNRCVSE